MRDRPSGAELLDEARATLLKELLDRLPSEQQHRALMVAKAIAVAQRELAAGEAPLRAELASLVDYYGEVSMNGEPFDGLTNAEGPRIQAALVRLNRRLAEDIRAGRADGSTTVFALLRRVAVEKLRESNPKLLPPELR